MLFGLAWVALDLAAGLAASFMRSIYTHARNIRFLPQLEAMEAERRIERAT